MKKTYYLHALLLCLSTVVAQAQHWYKGNLHTHSLWSDGDDYPEMIMDWYKANGYQFVGLSDHNVIQDVEKWVNVPHQQDRRRTFDRYLRTFGPDWVVYKKGGNDSLRVRLKKLDEYRSYFEEPGKFMIIKSEEVSTGYQGKPIHMNITNVKNLVRPLPGNSVAEVMQNNIDMVVAQRRQTGQPMFPHINHPNFYYAIKAEDLMQLRYERFFEVFNGHHLVNNYGDSTHEGTESMWDKINLHFVQQGRPLMYGLGTDDSHNYYFFGPSFSNSGRGWVMVNAPELTPKAIVEAMEAGRFYASSGVTLKQLPQVGNSLVVRVSPEKDVTYRIQFFGIRKGSQQAELLKELADSAATYTLTDDLILLRAKIISSKPKYNPFMPGDVETAWTQPIANKQIPQQSIASITPLLNAHAHNDYEQSRPLWDALENGFTSVEADVHLIDDTLYVSHDRPSFKNAAATLENLYLKPLAERIRQHNGQVFPGYKGPFHLMIDAKTGADSTYQALAKLLQRYRSLIASGGKNQTGPVTIVLSGNRPISAVTKANNHLVTLDGRPSDLGKGFSKTVMPIISDSYPNQLGWRGQGDMPSADFQKLRQLVDRVHQEGKKIRLWASPEDPAVWAKLREAGVDFLSTDQQELVRDFLTKRNDN
ncbi:MULTISPECIES: histidinol-phosphatase [unclassified Spirosoma]|uniref:histidinol-phosphatase n=1 Tax=unclassified Spirosoma TaxID=2621999 RepID=UPI00095BA887|nr:MULTISPECIES: histidinol-phosphatase [unclassified Spirosoma]MBN8821841.1 histidinol-phosphatase [Spirosoma sp.]OJW80671.1 MAG: histidinol-phosphatase [Spirosoma sp. 48-14]